MKKITVVNEKGGVGKTTVAVTVAAGLAARGHRVLLIDADAQGHATLSLGLNKYPGLYNLLVRWDELLDRADGDRGAAYRAVTKMVQAETYKTGPLAGPLAVIGSNVETRNIAHSISDAWALADHLDAVGPLFDYCLIDTAPTPSLLHGAIYMATDVIIYPTLCEYWSMDGLAESISRLDSVRKSRAIRVGGIVPMCYRMTTLEHQQNLGVLRERFGTYVWPEVKERILWAEAVTYRRPVYLQDPASDAAAQAWELVDRVEAMEVQRGE